jgi:hypothetical protein
MDEIKGWKHKVENPRYDIDQGRPTLMFEYAGKTVIVDDEQKMLYYDVDQVFVGDAPEDLCRPFVLPADPEHGRANANIFLRGFTNHPDVVALAKEARRRNFAGEAIPPGPFPIPPH